MEFDLANPPAANQVMHGIKVRGYGMEGGGEENSQWVERRGGLKFHHTKH
jgi:hypothetical protein